MNTENNKIAIICITQNGKNLALKLQRELIAEGKIKKEKLSIQPNDSQFLKYETRRKSHIAKIS